MKCFHFHVAICLLLLTYYILGQLLFLRVDDEKLTLVNKIMAFVPILSLMWELEFRGCATHVGQCFIIFL